MKTRSRCSNVCASPSLERLEHGSLGPAVEQAAAGIVMADIYGIIQPDTGAAGEDAVQSCEPPPQKPQTASPVFNREAFLERLMGDKEFAQEVVAAFVMDLPVLLMEMKEKIARGAVESVWKHAHKMKGAAANVGGEALRDVVLEMEQAGKAGDLAAVARCIPDLEMQAARLSEVLQQWVG